MQYSPHGNLENSTRAPKPQGSPWRGTGIQAEDPGLRPASAQYGHGLKIPNLPKLGSTNANSVNPQRSQSQQQQVPSFAQAVQRAQQSNPHTTPNKSLNNRTPVGSAKSAAAGVSGSQAPSEINTSESGVHILGSVNAQMMPRVNTSSGMSSLNTVLPGMSDTNGSRITHDSRPQQQGVPYTPNVQNLNLNEKQADPTAQSKAIDSDKYGLKSLLRVMDFSNKDKQSVVLGSDLSQSGLNLGSTSERLSHTFASPWQEMSKHFVVPDFKLPECYNIDTVVPQQQKLQNFDEGALFYIFYTMPRDAMQEAAAVELTNRSWRYHKELKMWLTKDPLSEPIQTNNQEESGIYIFFDPTTWKKIKREYILYYPDIA